MNSNNIKQRYFNEIFKISEKKNKRQQREPNPHHRYGNQSR